MFYLWPYGSFIQSDMKATVFLTYRDGSEVSFKFSCDDPEHDALATLLMVCRGTLMASSATRVMAYGEEGSALCGYFK